VNVRLTETTPLSEAGTATSSGRWHVQAISAGKGSSGTYSPEVLKEAAKKQLIAAGTPLFFDHASESERHDRPERSVRDIAAVFTGPATYDETREALVGPVQVFGPYRELVSEMAPHIGLSISGSATDIVNGVVEGLAHIDSVDLVTKAGRGGQFMSLLESARAEVARQATESNLITALAEATSNDTRDALSNLLRDEYGGEHTYVWVRDFDESTVWFEVNADGGDCGLYGQGFTNNAGAVALTGERTEVRVVTTYVPAQSGGSKTTQEVAQMADEQPGTTETTTAPGTAPPAATEAATTTQAAEPGTPGQAAPGAPPAAESTPSPTKENDMTDTTPGAGGTAPTQEAAPAAPRNPREVMEAQMREQGRQIALLRAGQVARGIVAEVLASGWIGEAQAARLTNELIAEANLPLKEDHELDEAKLRATALARLDEAETEAAEILASAGVGKVQGLGSTTRATEVALQRRTTTRSASRSGARPLRVRRRHRREGTLTWPRTSTSRRPARSTCRFAGTVSGSPVIVGMIPGVAVTDRDSDRLRDRRPRGHLRPLGHRRDRDSVGLPVYINSATYALVVAPGAGIQLFGHALATKAGGAGTSPSASPGFAVASDAPA
jgi:hypothetical protein